MANITEYLLEKNVEVLKLSLSSQIQSYYVRNGEIIVNILYNSNVYHQEEYTAEFIFIGNEDEIPANLQEYTPVNPLDEDCLFDLGDLQTNVFYRWLDR